MAKVIGIDGNEANIRNRVGVNKYAFEVIWGIYNLVCEADKTESLIVVVYLKDTPLSDMPKETNNFKYKVLRGGKVWIITKLTPYLLMNPERLSAFFAPSHYVPPFITIPKVCAVMDLGYLENSDQFTKKDFWQLKYWTAYSIRVSKYVLTISKATREDIVRHYPASKNKIVVTYPGVDDNLRKNMSATLINEVKKKYSIVGEYILYLGTLKPSKNIEGLIHAFSILKSGSSNFSLQLVIAGKKGWLYESIFSLVKELNLEKDVVFTDFIPEEDKAALIRGTKVFVLPSFWEGFGLDILTAFALERPVVASNIGSIPEVVGEAGILVNPAEIPSISVGIEEVLKMNKTDYNKLIEKEKKQMMKFSWRKMSEQTMDVLRKIAYRQVDL